MSSIPFNGPTGSVRVGLINDEFVINPKNSELESSMMNLVVSGTEDAVMMVEASGKEISEDKFVDAIMFGFAEIKKIVQMQKELVAKCGREKQEQAIEAMKQYGLTIHKINNSEMELWQSEVDRVSKYLRGNIIPESIYDTVIRLTDN